MTEAKSVYCVVRTTSLNQTDKISFLNGSWDLKFQRSNNLQFYIYLPYISFNPYPANVENMVSS